VVCNYSLFQNTSFILFRKKDLVMFCYLFKMILHIYVSDLIFLKWTEHKLVAMDMVTDVPSLTALLKNPFVLNRALKLLRKKIMPHLLIDTDTLAAIFKY
jgi:hypothetical protein